MELQDKVVIVTGASRGIGQALAVELAREGARVVCAARGTRGSATKNRKPGALEDTIELVQAAGGDAIAVPTDMGDEDQVGEMVEQAVRHYGRLDGLVNNAAATRRVTDLFSDLAEMDAEWNVNFRGTLIAMRAAVPHMRRQREGAIVNVTSLLGLNYMQGRLMYGVSKLALERLTMDAAVQLRGDRIACNAFRIDLPVFAEDTLAESSPIVVATRRYHEPPVVAARGIVWMLQQPPEYTGRLESMKALREREGEACMPTTASELPPEDSASRWSW